LSQFLYFYEGINPSLVLNASMGVIALVLSDSIWLGAIWYYVAPNPPLSLLYSAKFMLPLLNPFVTV
jgi:hypothetical protein